jgi:vacuolar-type H+-ATPase subunit I/STV1
MASLLERIRAAVRVELGTELPAFTGPFGLCISLLCEHVEKAVADLSERIDSKWAAQHSWCTDLSERIDGLARVRSEQDASLSKRIAKLEVQAQLDHELATYRLQDAQKETEANRKQLAKHEERLDWQAAKLGELRAQILAVSHPSRVDFQASLYAQAHGVKVATSAGPIKAGEFVTMTAPEPTFIPREYVKRADVVGTDCDGQALCVGGRSNGAVLGKHTEVDCSGT